MYFSPWLPSTVVPLTVGGDWGGFNAGTGPTGVAVGAGQLVAVVCTVDWPLLAKGLCVTKRVTIPATTTMTTTVCKIRVRRRRSYARRAARAWRLLNGVLVVLLAAPLERELLVCDGICW